VIGRLINLLTAGSRSGFAAERGVSDDLCLRSGAAMPDGRQRGRNGGIHAGDRTLTTQQYIISPYHPIGHTYSIFSVPAILLSHATVCLVSALLQIATALTDAHPCENRATFSTMWNGSRLSLPLAYPKSLSSTAICGFVWFLSDLQRECSLSSSPLRHFTPRPITVPQKEYSTSSNQS
jgi:hypothetical protein